MLNIYNIRTITGGGREGGGREENINQLAGLGHFLCDRTVLDRTGGQRLVFLPQNYLSVLTHHINNILASNCLRY